MPRGCWIPRALATIARVRSAGSSLRQLGLADRGDAFVPIALDLLLLGAGERRLQLIQHRLGRMPGDRGLYEFDAAEARRFVVGAGRASGQQHNGDDGQPSAMAHLFHSCLGQPDLPADSIERKPDHSGSCRPGHPAGGPRLLARQRAAIPASYGDSPSLRRTMADMRVVIAGAGGRMGRTLIHAIAATKGLTLAGAVDAPGAAVIGRDAGELAGLGANGIKVVSDVA